MAGWRSTTTPPNAPSAASRSAARIGCFAGSDEGGKRAAAIYTLTETARLNGIDPRAYLGDILSRLATHPAKLIDNLLPWRWATAQVQAAIAA